jgi:hypothetical protein
MDGPRQLWPRWIVVGGLAFLAYAALAHAVLWRPSIAPHFAYLAEAWTHGRHDLGENLPSTYDLIRYEDKWYVAQQPLPALLMLPPAFILPPTRLYDVLFTVVLGALSVALADTTLGRFAPGLSPLRRSLLTLFFAAGNPHLYLATLGTVWFTGQVAAGLSLWLFLWGLLTRRPWLLGLGLAGVLLARPSMMPGAGALWLGWWLFHHEPHWRRGFIIICLVLGMAALFLGLYNAARFGSALDFGYEYLQDAGNIRARRMEHGTFSPVFLPDNLYTAVLRPPVWENSHLRPDPWGMGIVWSSPALVLIGGAFWRVTRAERQQALLLAGCAGLMLLPALLYHNSGSLQFGYRFLLDALPVLVLLLALAAPKFPSGLLGVSVGLSVAVNLWGFGWIYPLITGAAWRFGG